MKATKFIALLVFSLPLCLSGMVVAEAQGRSPLPPYQSPDEPPEWGDVCRPGNERRPDTCPDGWECRLSESRCSLSDKLCNYNKSDEPIGCDSTLVCGACRAITPEDKLDLGFCDSRQCGNDSDNSASPTPCREDEQCTPCWSDKANQWVKKCNKDLASIGLGVCDGCRGEGALCDPKSNRPDECAYFGGAKLEDRCNEVFRCRKIGELPDPPKLGPKEDRSPSTEPPVIITQVDKCTLEVVNGLIKMCCCDLKEWGPSCNCTTYAHTFHELCVNLGIKCETLHIYCTHIAHAVNIAHLEDGRCQLVEPQGALVGSPFPCEQDPPKEYVCRAIGLPEDCSCTLKRFPDPVTPNTKEPDQCSREANNGTGCRGCAGPMTTCESCCRQECEGPGRGGCHQGTGAEWWKECYETCKEWFGSPA
jgi:hypothetical protein